MRLRKPRLIATAFHVPIFSWIRRLCWPHANSWWLAWSLVGRTWRVG